MIDTSLILMHPKQPEERISNNVYPPQGASQVIRGVAVAHAFGTFGTGVAVAVVSDNSKSITTLFEDRSPIISSTTNEVYASNMALQMARERHITHLDLMVNHRFVRSLVRKPHPYKGKLLVNEVERFYLLMESFPIQPRIVHGGKYLPLLKALKEEIKGEYNLLPQLKTYLAEANNNQEKEKENVLVKN